MAHWDQLYSRQNIDYGGPECTYVHLDPRDDTLDMFGSNESCVSIRPPSYSLDPSICCHKRDVYIYMPQLMKRLKRTKPICDYAVNCVI